MGTTEGSEDIQTTLDSKKTKSAQAVTYRLLRMHSVSRRTQDYFTVIKNVCLVQP